MTRANHRHVSFRRAALFAAPLTLAGLFGPTLFPASAQQTLLEYSQPTTAAATSPYAPPANRYAAQPAAGATASPPAAAIPDRGNPFIRTGPPRSTLLNLPPSGSATTAGPASTSASANYSTSGSRYPSAIPAEGSSSTPPAMIQPVAAQPLVPVQPTAAGPRYDDQVRPATYDMPPTVPMAPVVPSTPSATIGGPALAVAPSDSRYTQQPDSRSAPATDNRYAQAPATGTSPYSQQQTNPAAAGIQTAATLPVQPTSPTTGGPQPLPHQPQQLSGLAILRQKPLDEQAARMQHPLTPMVAWLEDAIRQMDANVRDYSCTFKKRELVDNKLSDQQSMFVKMRMQPFSVYFYFLDQSVQGQEALYVAGKNNGNLLAHPTGIKQALVGTLSLAPNDPQAMDGNRYPITDFGMRRLAERFLERSKYEMQFGECNVRIVEARIDGRVCTCVETVHPVKRAEFRYNVSRLYIDNELNLPIRCEGYDWPERAGDQPQLIEEYTYTSLKLNQGFTDMDFDAANPQYTFK